MFRFFRQIRQKLLSNAQFGRYLLYAIGEIFLVVVGILIALQVDTWNEGRKLVQQEIALLNDMRSDLQETLKELQFGKSLNETTVANYRMLLEAIDRNEEYSPKIDSASVQIAFFHVPRFRRTTYESLKSQGEILSNDSLKREISDIYDRLFTYLTEDQLKVEWAIFNQKTLDYTARYLRSKDSPTPMVYPVDFEAMKSDTEFINYLSSLISVRKFGIYTYGNTIAEIQKVIASIDTELETLEQ
ncbi:MAG: DUF6090 family protein [Robiginitalea sp.]|nr:DUF6090 family protein [Robiginitalea sp.]